MPDEVIFGTSEYITICPKKGVVNPKILVKKPPIEKEFISKVQKKSTNNEYREL